MVTIWKYQIPAGASWFKVTMPQDSIPLHVASASIGWINLWVEVDTDCPSETRTFCVTGTGDLLPPVSPHTYLGTALEQETDFVWHLHEIGVST